MAQFTSSSPFILSDMEEIQSLDVSHIGEVIFTENTGKIHHVNFISIKKIASFLEKRYEKNTFEALELKEVGEYLIKNYQSNLPENEYKKLIQILGNWVENGGKFEIIENKKTHPLVNVIKFFVSIIMIVFGGFYLVSGSMYFTGFNSGNPDYSTGISVIIGGLLLISIGNWLLFKKGTIYYYIGLTLSLYVLYRFIYYISYYF